MLEALRTAWLALVVASACTRGEVAPAPSPPASALPASPGPTEAREPSALERCLRVAETARATGRVDLVADALAAAAALDPTPTRKLEWARALADVDPRKARIVARELGTDALGLPEPAALPPPDPQLADRVLAAQSAGQNDAVVRELAPRVESLSLDMLHRLAKAYERNGDLRAAERIWNRARHADVIATDGSVYKGRMFTGVNMITSEPNFNALTRIP